MNSRFVIYKSKGNDKFHARFIFKEADRICETDTAALCMDNKDKKRFTPFI